MKIPLNWLKEYVDIKDSPEKIAAVLTMRAYETSVVGREVIDVDVLPNRGADSLSVFGIAAELAAIYNKPLKVKKVSFMSTGKPIKELLKVEVRVRESVGRYMAGMINGVKVGPSPKWLKQRLESLGLKSVDNLVDITNFVMFELGQPLHIFDLEKIKGQKIIVRRAQSKEKFKALNGEELKLASEDLIIADSSNPLALAGIIGGEESAVSEKTKNIIVESANFNSILIRKSSLKHNIKTDSSYRFEQGLDPNLAEEGLKRALSLIQEIGGGEIAKGEIDIYPKKVLPTKIKLELAEINKVLGANLKLKEMENILKRLRFEFVKNGDKLLISVPTRRRDIKITEDVIEEIGRLYGYENIKPRIPVLETKVYPADSSFDWQLLAKDYLKALGFNEAYNYSLVSARDVKVGKEKEIELKNPVSEERKFLRDNLLAGLLENVKLNFKFKDTFKIFELGKIFYLDSQLGKPRENLYLAGILHNQKSEPSTWKRGFQVVKGDLEALFEELGIVEKWYDTYHPVEKSIALENWDKDFTAEIKIRDEAVGFLGVVSQETKNKYNIKGSVVAFEINFEKLITFLVAEREFSAIPKYPAATRDISMLVDGEVKISKILSLMYEVGGEIVEDIDLFDIYDDETFEGKKSLAFHIIYRSRDKTLTDEEISRVHNKIEDILKKEAGVEVR